MDYLGLFLGIVNLCIGFILLKLQAKTQNITVFNHMKKGLGLYYFLFFVIISTLIILGSTGII